ncbi:MAG: ABC transporter ATP-binding protein [Anaerolineales bacterium]|nr:ABC transporter ATP-binding protein [Anaerolineales bacterium]
MVEAHELVKRFDDFIAVRGLSLRVQPGEVLALLGPNGAGKTTTVRMLHAILKPTSGWARVAGYDVVHQAEAVRRSVGVLTEHHGLYFRMQAEEYLSFFGELYGLTPAICRKRAAYWLERFGMREAISKRLGEYSKGMRQKLALIRALLHDPPVLLLDEPTSAMDPESARLVRDAITQLRSDKRAIILCTHNLTEAEQLADQIAIIRRGTIVARGSPEQLKRDLLGPPLLELRTAAPLNGIAHSLSDLVEIVETGDNWLRYRTPDPATDNPLILQRLTERRVPVITLAEVPRSLEDVYLQVIAQR